MAHVVETGAGLSDANAYLSLADAVLYFADHANAAWTSTDAAKEAAIRAATQYLDAYYHLFWKGDKKLSTQALDWPRAGVCDENHYPIASDSLPTKLKEACAEMAVRALTESLLPDVAPASSGALISKSVEVGPISVSKTWAGSGQSTTKYYRIADLLLADLVLDSNALIRA